MSGYQTKSDKPTRKVLGMTVTTSVLVVCSNLFFVLVPVESGWPYGIALTIVAITSALINYWIGYLIKPLKRDGVEPNRSE